MLRALQVRSDDSGQRLELHQQVPVWSRQEAELRPGDGKEAGLLLRGKEEAQGQGNAHAHAGEHVEGDSDVEAVHVEHGQPDQGAERSEDADSAEGSNLRRNGLGR